MTARLGRMLALGIWRSSLQSWSWRSFLITLVIGQAVTPLLGLFVWSSALPAEPAVRTYFVVLLAVTLMTVSYEHHTLSNGIYDGNFGATLLEPRPPVIDFLAMNIALRIWHLLFGLPLLILVGLVIGMSLDASSVAIAVPATLLAAAVRFVWTYTLALSALWTQRAHGVVGFGETTLFLLGGTAAPLAFLPDHFRIVGQALPFWSMLGAPADIAAGNLDGAGILRAYLMQCSWLVVFIGVAVVMWRIGIRRFTALGG